MTTLSVIGGSTASLGVRSTMRTGGLSSLSLTGTCHPSLSGRASDGLLDVLGGVPVMSLSGMN